MPSNSSDRQRLLRLARLVRDRVDDSDADPLLRLVPPSRLTAIESDTDGWFVTIGRIEGVAGELQVWLDASAGAPDGRRVSATFTAKTDTNIIPSLAKVGTGVFGPAVVFTDAEYERRPDGVYQLRRPLPSGHYRRPLAELYTGSWWKFYTMYWPTSLKAGAALHRNSLLVAQVAAFFERVARAAGSLSVEAANRPYPSVKNRAVVREHLRRERSAKLALLAKLRQGFVCQVCGIDFGRLYGKLGRGFAEAHHKVALGSAAAPKTTRVSDLVTVCANCHRMLHRLSGKGSDLQTLRKLFTGKWPTPAA